MKRKSFILLIVLLVLSFSTVCFASNMGNDIKNTMNGATNAVVDGTQNLAEDVRSGIGTAENAIEDGSRNIGNAVMDGANDVMNAGDDAYTTARTATGDMTTINNTTATTWTWVVLSIAAVVIVSLVWYYAYQNNHKH